MRSSLKNPAPEKSDSNNGKALFVIAVIAIALFIGNKIDETNKKITTVSDKLDVTLYDYTSYRKSAEALNGTACAQCHISAGQLLPKSSLSQKEFTEYVRGTARFNTNNQMPKMSIDVISDSQLERIWKALY